MEKLIRRTSAAFAIVVLSLAATAAAYACNGGHGDKKGQEQHGAKGANVSFHQEGFRFTTALTTPDSGTCGNNWANDTLKRTYAVKKNSDGSFSLIAFDRGTFSTVAGQSPGACDTSDPHHGATVTVGITGRMGGFVAEKITGGTFNPNATCATVCDRNAFVAAFFGSSAQQSVDKFLYVYGAHDPTLIKHAWVNAGNATTSHNHGDIATA
jgi:hypothetical protein